MLYCRNDTVYRWVKYIQIFDDQLPHFIDVSGLKVFMQFSNYWCSIFFHNESEGMYTPDCERCLIHHYEYSACSAVFFLNIRMANILIFGIVNQLWRSALSQRCKWPCMCTYNGHAWFQCSTSASLPWKIDILLPDDIMQHRQHQLHSSNIECSPQ